MRQAVISRNRKIKISPEDRIIAALGRRRQIKGVADADLALGIQATRRRRWMRSGGLREIASSNRQAIGAGTRVPASQASTNLRETPKSLAKRPWLRPSLCRSFKTAFASNFGGSGISTVLIVSFADRPRKPSCTSLKLCTSKVPSVDFVGLRMIKFLSFQPAHPAFA